MSAGLDLSVQQDFLDALYGPVTGDVTVHLYHGHLNAGGVEIDFDGYVPGTLPDTGWNATDSDGVKWATTFVDCGTPTNAATDDATHIVLRNLGGDSCGCFRIPTLTIGGSGPAVEIRPAVFFGDSETN